VAIRRQPWAIATQTDGHVLLKAETQGGLVEEDAVCLHAKPYLHRFRRLPDGLAKPLQVLKTHDQWFAAMENDVNGRQIVAIAVLGDAPA
jgi:hypothetical protein